MKFVMGLVIGATISALVTIKILDSKYEERLQEEIESLREVQNRLREKKIPVPTEKKLFDRMVPEIQPASQAKYERMAEMYTKPPLAELMHPLDDGEDYDAEADYAKYSAMSSNVLPFQRKEPYVITDVEFCEENDHYDKITLYYYSDGTLTDENEEIIDDVDQAIGSDALEQFEDGSVESIYVRNDNRSIDYDICRLSCSFEGLQGLDDHSDDGEGPTKEFDDNET